MLILSVAAVAGLASCGGDRVTVEQESLPEVDRRMFIDLDSMTIDSKAQELDRLFSRLQQRSGFNGTVMYSEKGRVILKKAYGFRDVRYKKDSLRLNDAFQLASVSKMFTALAIMILEHEGKLDYDTDVRTYLPDLPYEGVTCRLLMNHRAGLPRYMSLAHEQWKNKDIPLSNDAMLELFVEHQPDRYFTPNGGFHYCNTNYALLANIVESVSGMYFEEFMEEKIFRPLGMYDSFIYQMRDDSVVPLYIQEGVPGYRHRGWRWRKMENDYLNGVVGDKGVYASAEDLYRFERSLDRFTLLPDSVLQEAFRPGSKRYWKRRNNYGFGWRIKDDMDSTAFHFGWWKGFRTFYIRDMRHHRTIIVLSNKDKGPGSDHFWNIFRSDTLPIGPYSELNN